jgi:hypothetical protein
MEDLLQVVREVPDFRNQIYEDNLTTLQADIGKLKTENARLHELVNGLQYDIKRMEDREWMLTKQARRSYDSDSGLDEPDESEYLVYRDTNGGVYSGNHGWTEEDDADHLTAQICYDRGSNMFTRKQATRGIIAHMSAMPVMRLYAEIILPTLVNCSWHVAYHLANAYVRNSS